MSMLIDRQIIELCTKNESSGTYRATKIEKEDQDSYVKDITKSTVIIDQDKPMIENAILEQKKYIVINNENVRVPSFGVSSAGYDLRLANEFKLFNKPNDGRVINILDFDEDMFCEHIKEDIIILPPGGFVLGRSIETFNIPKNIIGMATGKSTWARTGASVLVTPLEPGWSGELVVEITNGTNNPMAIIAGAGICQVNFHILDEVPETTYDDRGGKYQDQTGITCSKL